MNTFFEKALLVFKFLGCLVEDKNKRKDFACFFENPTNFKDWSASRVKISVTAPLSVFGRFFPVSTLH